MGFVPGLVLVTIEMNRMSWDGKESFLIVVQCSLSGVRDVFWAVGRNEDFFWVTNFKRGGDEIIEEGVIESFDFLVSYGV